MLKLFVRIKDTIRTIREEQSGQDAFEYLLVIGGVSVAVILAIATPIGGAVIDAVLTGTCAAIDGLPNMTVTC